MRRRITVSVDAPSGISDENLASYVADALGFWGGSLRPPGAYGEDDLGDPLFGGLEVRAIEIRAKKYVNQ